MGLLQKAQMLKKELDDSEDNIESDIIKNDKKKDSIGLLEKAQSRKGKIKKTKKIEKKPVKKEKKKEKQEKIEIDKKQEEVIDERTGFGWKGIGRRQIIFDKAINEYVYTVSEPVLDVKEQEIKKELVRLFKMLSDADVTDMEKDERKKYLQDTLNQIIIDNDIKFQIGSNQDILHQKLYDYLEEDITDFIMKDEDLELEIERTMIDNKVDLYLDSKDKIFYHLFRDFLGYGKMDILMEDTGIEDISCDGHHVPIFLYHKKYEGISTNIKFENSEELDSLVVRLSQICGKQISIYSPIVDGKLPDGSRLQTTLAKTVTKGSTYTIRRFRENPLTPIDLIKFKSLSIDMAAYFWLAIENGSSILFCGGTASGKTTALNALSLFIPSTHKIITIEDTREVSLPHKNWIAGTTRQGFASSEDSKTGKDIDMFDLIRAALRQRPKVIMVGEVRGKEAYSLFQAMATGHTAYSTVHASTIHTLIQRLENPPIKLPRALLTSLDIIVFQNAINIGGKAVRRMTSVTEVIKLDPDTNQLIFMEPFSWVSKTDDRFENTGTSKIINNIRLENDWTEEKINKEVQNRKKILQWMIKNNVRDYREVGQIVSDYQKFPEMLLQKIKRGDK